MAVSISGMDNGQWYESTEPIWVQTSLSRVETPVCSENYKRANTLMMAGMTAVPRGQLQGQARANGAFGTNSRAAQ
jgi:hypothetical protein